MHKYLTIVLVAVAIACIQDGRAEEEDNDAIIRKELEVVEKRYYNCQTRLSRIVRDIQKERVIPLEQKLLDVNKWSKLQSAYETLNKECEKLEDEVHYLRRFVPPV